MSGTRFEMLVIGEGRVRARGELAFVLPQALDLVGRSSYTVSIRESVAPKGSLRLRGRDGQVVEADYEPMPGLPAAGRQPSWLASVPNLSASLGRSITWRTTSP